MKKNIRDQRIRDPIHNLISFSAKVEEDKLLWQLINTPPIQRLRRIKQLGFSEFVYPGATHTRFSHVLGAMEMARRMLAVFERNKIFKQDSAHTHMRKATVAAALLHDIGHGPYSHVFEELSSEFGVEEDHENITLKLLDEQRVSEILNHFNVYDDVKKFFEKEPGYNPYTRIITSQMDCDRLNFLSRDRYHTGLRSSFIDLAWLFDSLTIQNVVIDPINDVKEYSFVLGKKGIGVAEEFVLAYHKLYRDVYFHKTTRGVQHLVKDMVISLHKTGYLKKKPLVDNPIVKYWFFSESRNIDHFLSLDDSALLSLIHTTASGEYAETTTLARRYLDRDLYKCIELPALGDGEIRTNLAWNFFNHLKDKKILYIADTPPIKSYKQYEVMDENFLQNILIEQDGEPRPLGAVSRMVNTVTGKLLRVYFPSAGGKEAAERVLKNLS